MNLGVSDRQIGETVFNLLRTEQQHDLIGFIIDIEKLIDHTAYIPCVSLPRQVEQDNEELLTEIQIGDLYFCPKNGGLYTRLER